MFGFGRKRDGATGGPPGEPPAVSTKLCTDKLKGVYPHVGLYDCKATKVWVAKPLNGQAIRTAHARLILGGSDNNVSTAWKDRFLCFWLYTPDTGEGDVIGYPVDWKEGNLIVRVDPAWDYDRQRLIPIELTDLVDDNLARQSRHGERIFRWYTEQGIRYPLALHLVGTRLSESRFYYRRFEPGR